MPTTDFSRAGTSIQVTQGSTVVGTYDKEGSSYAFISTNLLQVLVVEAGLVKSFRVSLSDLRVSGAGSAPADQAAALTALALVWADATTTLYNTLSGNESKSDGAATPNYVSLYVASVLPLEYVALISQSGTNAPTALVRKNALAGAWTYVMTGTYRYVFTTPVADATKLFVPNNMGQGYNFNEGAFSWRVQTLNVAYVEIWSMDGIDPSDDKFTDFAIKIQYYP